MPHGDVLAQRAVTAARHIAQHTVKLDFVNDVVLGQGKGGRGTTALASGNRVDIRVALPTRTRALPRLQQGATRGRAPASHRHRQLRPSLTSVRNFIEGSTLASWLMIIKVGLCRRLVWWTRRWHRRRSLSLATTSPALEWFGVK